MESKINKKIEETEEEINAFIDKNRKKLTTKAKNLINIFIELYEAYDEGLEIKSSYLNNKVNKYFGDFATISQLNNPDFEELIFSLMRQKLENKKITPKDFLLMSSIVQKNNALRLEKYRQKSTESYLVEGAKNRRGFEIEAIKAIDRFKKELRLYGTDKICGLVMMYLDIDNFKSFNDDYGHHVGDKAIKKIGALILSQIRNTDIAGHLHGDEYAILLSETNIKKLVSLFPGETQTPLQRLKMKLDKLEINSGEQKMPITISCGIAEIEIDDNTDKKVIAKFKRKKSDKIFIELLNEADASLQKAKEYKKAGVENTIILPNGQLIK